MWDQIDENISNTMGIPKGQAFQHAVEQRSAMKKPPVHRPNHFKNPR